MLLTDGEDLYNIVLNAPIGICILNADTLVAEIVNGKFLEVAGKPYDAIFGKFYWDAFAEARTHYESALAGVILSGEPYYANEVELMLIRHGEEEIVFVTFVYAPIKDKLGQVIKVAVWVLENTKQVAEKKEQEAEKLTFKKERDRLERYFMQAPVGICILQGQELIYELTNTAYDHMLLDRKLLGRPIFEALPELVDSPIQQMLLKTYYDGTPCEMNDVLIPVSAFEGGPTKDRYFSFSFQARRDENDVIDGVVNIVFEVTGLIQIQQELLDAREYSEQQKRVYETITSNTPDLMYVFDLNCRFTYANSALLSMWGKTWENAIGKSLLENGYEPWHAEMHEREIATITKTRQSIRGEVSFPHASLGRRIYDYILIPVLNQDGEVEAVAGTTRDITERKVWEDTLAQSAEKLQAINEELEASNEEQAASNEELSAINEELEQLNKELLEAKQKIEEGEVALRLAVSAANFGTWFLHSVTREFITDTRLKQLFGYFPEEQLSFENALAQVREDYRDYVSAKLEYAIYHNGNYDVTFPVIGYHDQELRWLRCIGNLKADTSGTFSTFTGVVMDITEQHLAANNVEQAEEGLRLAIESGELAIWYLDQKLGTIIASPRFNEMFGLRSDENVPFDAVIAQILPEYRQMVEDAVAATFATGANFNVEYAVTGFHDGKLRWVRSVGKYVQNTKNGNYIAGVMADITEQKTDDIRKSDFIGMVSHELKTPLTSLNAYLQLLQQKLKSSNEKFAINALDQSVKQVRKMTTMINGFLNISRLESGKIHIDLQHFDIAELAAETVAETKLMVTTHNIILKPIAPTFVNADRDKIGQVINNLISNAVKYSKPDTLIEVSCITDGQEMRVSVTDEGIGIRAEDINQLFERYYRVESTKYISGFGIGLYLCAEIIKRHEGRIWVESEPEKGSTFYFSLPIVKSTTLDTD